MTVLLPPHFNKAIPCPLAQDIAKSKSSFQTQDMQPDVNVAPSLPRMV